MSNKYRLINGNVKAIVPSVDYVDERIKEIKDALGIETNGVHFDVESDIEVLKNEDIRIKPHQVETNSQQKFVSNAQMKSFSDRVTKTQFYKEIDSVRKEEKEYIDTIIKEISHSPEIIRALKLISEALNRVEDKDALSVLLNAYVTYSDLDAHENMKGMHLSENERKALNILVSIIKDGGIDWNGDSLLPIKNIPSSFKANGGNCDTVQGKNAETLYNGVYDWILDDEEIKLLNSSDLYYKLRDEYNYIFLKKSIISIPFGITIDRASELAVSYNNRLHIKSCLSSIISSTLNLVNNICIEGIVFDNCEITIGSNVTFKDCTFTYCTLKFDESREVRLVDSILRVCTVSYDNIMYCIIKNNIVETCSKSLGSKLRALDYIGGNNIIHDNLYV